TLRRHAAALHSHWYRKWCDANNFNSMLLEDTRQRKEAALDRSLQTQQTVLSDHFDPPGPEVIPYSDRAFEAAAIEWLVHTNQPIQTFKNPMFKTMLDIASRASKGITLPSPKKTRTRIIHMFKQKMYLLRDHLNVSFVVSLVRAESLISAH
ncbi:hypothetical protein EDB92DRAFT_1802910, partial [Lactarius akahatsu]